MSALTAVVLTSLISTPVVHVTHDVIVEKARTTPAVAQHVAAPAVTTGIDDVALDAFVTRTALRYRGF